MAYAPSTEMVAVAWGKTIDGVDSTKVATSLPGDPTVWAATGFVTVTAFPGAVGTHVPLYSPVVTFDCWANTPNSNKAPWGQAAALAMAVLQATYDAQPLDVEVPAGYSGARVLSVYPTTMPRRVPSDTSGFARVSLDVSIAWTVIP
jgi:hypothetical protein